mgnify:CR=1 FL=1
MNSSHALRARRSVLRMPRIGMVVHPIGGRYVAVQTAGAPHLWSRIVALIGRPELASDPRFATVMLRRTNWGDLLPILQKYGIAPPPPGALMPLK